MDFWLLLLTSALASGVVRNITGWLMSALKDGKVDKYEWKKGLFTLLSSAVVTAALVFTGINPVSAAAYAIPIDMLISALKSKAGIVDPVQTADPPK